MTQSSASSFQAPNPMKKKIVIALLAVVVGHTAVLWGVSQMKTPELKPIEKKPIKVKLVKIKEDLPPPPPPKKEEVKPKEVKIVEKPTPPPVKKIEKVKATEKETPKKVLQPVVVPPKPAPVISTTTGTTPKATPAPTPAPAPAPTVAAPAPAPAPPAGPINIGGSGVKWSSAPKFGLNASELKGACSVSVLINGNEKGAVTNVEVKNTTCSAAVTRKVTTAVRRARFTPYTENGVAYPIIAQQPFELK